MILGQNDRSSTHKLQNFGKLFNVAKSVDDILVLISRDCYKDKKKQFMPSIWCPAYNTVIGKCQLKKMMTGKRIIIIIIIIILSPKYEM